MAGAGVPMRTLQEWLGHRDCATTLIHADYSPSEQEREWGSRPRSPVGVWVPPEVPLAEMLGSWADHKSSGMSRSFCEMELAGLEPATSWVRYRVRGPNRGDLSSLGFSKFS
jgi:hypothetical protein